MAQKIELARNLERNEQGNNVVQASYLHGAAVNIFLGLISNDRAVFQEGHVVQVTREKG